MNAHNEQQALPCPFCGAEPDLSFNSVSCGCAASPFIDREDALQVWNTRAAQPSPVVKQNLTTQPAAAQEAVAWQVDDEFYPSESLAIEAIQQWGPSGAIAIPLYAAAPVTAAPAATLVAAMRNFADVADRCQITEGNAGSVIRTWADQIEASIPAAPGIDLTPFKQVAKFAKYWADEVGNDEVDAEADRLLALIDASPKGDHFGDATRMAQDSPKGGSEARDAARYRWLKTERLQLWRDTLTGKPVSCSFDFDEPGHDVDAAIDAAMQAQAGDAEVQP